MNISATCRAVAGGRTSEASNVEQSGLDVPDHVSEIVSAFYETKAEAEAEANGLKKAEEGTQRIPRPSPCPEKSSAEGKLDNFSNCDAYGASGVGDSGRFASDTANL